MNMEKIMPEAKLEDITKIQVEANTPYLQAIRNNRLLAFLVVFLVLALVSTVLAGAYVYANKPPVKEVIYIEFLNGTNNFVRVVRAGKDLEGNRLLVDANIRRYVVDREGIDRTTEGVRYPRVMQTSSEDVGAVFKRKYASENPMYKRKGFEREISITRSNPIDEGIYQVEFKSTDKTNGISSKPRFYVANIAYSFQDQKITFDDSLMNPMGLFVETYSISERRNSK